jgi:CheY-like chemotaxis protein
MEPEVMARIFDPFYSTKGPDEGTGLGLSVVHGIITGYRGRITVQSSPGEGTTFQIDLPRIDWQPEDEPDAEATPPRGSGRILLVDDEATLVYIGQQGLVDLGYEVETRTSGIEALHTFRENPDRFDAVITDQSMPLMTGEELARELLRIRPGLPIILCTGFSPTMPPEKAKSIGIQAYLMKPLGIRDLAKTLQDLIGPRGKVIY